MTGSARGPVAASPPVRDPLLAVRAVSKSYGGIHALRGASLQLSRPGVVHGLLGHNGSGKSTLLGVLSGQIRPDRGSVVLDGRDMPLGSPVTALRHGIAMVSQENATAAHLSIAENILMGRRLAGSAWKVSWRGSARRARAVLDVLELDYDPHWLVSRLRPDQKQMVEIARAISMDARIIVLDEPTSSLSDYEVERLFAAVRRLAATGVSAIFVSHRLAEFFAIVDELTVLRDGATVLAGPVGQFTPAALVEAMVGSTAHAEHAPAAPDGGGAARGGLRIRSLRCEPHLFGVDLQVAAGEIVGVAGLSGCGRSELIECVFGVRRPDAGTVEIDGRPRRFRSPNAAIAAGLGYLPPERKAQGLVLQMSVEDNLRMVSSHRRARLTAPPQLGADRPVARRVIEQLRVRTPSAATPVAALSGGNQQKVALGKWLVAGSRILLLDEPTRGVDAAGKAEIHRLLRGLADGGCALLVSSSENDELLEICDRVVVLFRGRVAATLDPARADEALIAHHAGGFE